MTTYFDVIIRDNSFYIVESSRATRPYDSALRSLKKIESVVKDRLTYDSTRKDCYSDLSQDKLYKLLKTKSSQIYQGYHNKQAKLNWIFRKIFSQEKEICKVLERIPLHLNPPQVLPLPNELIQQVSQYLDVSDLKVLSQLNHHGKAHAEIAILKRAEEFGYYGGNYAEAIQHIDHLSKEVIALAKEGLIPKKHLAYKGKYLDPEAILHNLKRLSTQDLFVILSNENLYSQAFQHVIKIFPLNRQRKVTPIHDEKIKQKGNYALVLALKKRDSDIAELLLSHGVDPNIPNQLGNSPFHAAAQLGLLDFVGLFLKHGARIDEGGANRCTALGYACGYVGMSVVSPNIKMVELLLQHGANPNIADQTGHTPLHWAAHSHSPDIVDLLLKHGAQVDTRTEGHHTPLAYACGYVGSRGHNPNQRSVELLLNYGANPNIPDVKGVTPFHWATYVGSTDIVNLLLKHRARVNQRDYKGRTALNYACCYGDGSVRPNPRLVELLLLWGADPNLDDERQRAPLHLAVSTGFAECVALLLKHGARIDQRGGRNYTVMDYALGRGKMYHKTNPAVVDLLRLHGA